MKDSLEAVLISEGYNFVDSFKITEDTDYFRMSERRFPNVKQLATKLKAVGTPQGIVVVMEHDGTSYDVEIYVRE